MTAVLHSFNELATMMSTKPLASVKACQRSKPATLKMNHTNVVAKCGPVAAAIWSFMNDQEAGRCSGRKGEILVGIARLQRETGEDESTILGAVVALVSNGWAHLTPNGQYVRAA